MKRRATRVIGVVVLCAALTASAVVVSGAGATEVRLSPATESVDPGETVEYEVVVAEASGGVGSFNATVSVNDSSVATIESVRYADSPAYANQPDGGASVQLTATGMDTVQSGPVDLATVAVRAENPGTVGLSVSVTALGDENGSAYTVTGTQGRTLTVEEQTDDSGTGDDSDSDGTGDDDDDSDSVTPTPTPTETATPTETPTSTETSTTTATETPAVSDTPDEEATQSPSPTATTTSTTGVEPGSLQPVPLAVIGGLVILVAGLIYYRRM